MRCRILLVLATFTIAACGGDDPADSSDVGRTPPDVSGDATSDVGGTDADAGSEDATEDAADTGEDVSDDAVADTDAADTAPDAVEDAPETTCSVDQDGDGHIAMMCGGDDCDDNEPRRYPGLPERCDDLDNDCNAQVNDGITCAFYVHTSEDLYLLDPFAEDLTFVAAVPRFFDIDTHPDGTLYGVGATGLYRFNEGTGAWELVGGDFASLDGEGNGLAIDPRGNAFMTAGDTVYTVDLSNGDHAVLGDMGGDFVSSGDIVVNKDGTMYMSSKHISEVDTLVEIDGTTGLGTAVGNMTQGATNYENVFGLTAAWDMLFGVTSGGQLLVIDDETAATELITTFDGVRFWGAASSPDR